MAIVVTLAAALLQTTAVNPSPAASPAPRKTDKMVCKVEEETGSRLSSRRRCMPASQWEEVRRLERQTLERVQSQARTPGG